MKKRILLVEDEAVIALSQTELLEQHGFEVRTAGNAEDAIAAAAADIDLILMDINLGAGMDGSEAARRILAARDVPILFLTNHNDGENLKRAESVVSYGYIAKNSADAVLVASVNMALRLSDAKRRMEIQERTMRTTLYSIGDGVIAVDTDGRVTRMNGVAERLCGLTENEGRGRPLSEVFHIENEQTGAPVENPVVRVIREGCIVGLANHTVLVARDGTRRPIADSGSPIFDPDGALAGVILVFRDQTEEREQTRRLEESERRYRSALDGLLEGCQIIDFEFRYIYVNAAAAAHGRTVPEALIGRKMVDVYPGIEATAVFADIAASMIDRRPRKSENEFFFESGPSGWFELSIQPVEEGVLILSVETTERKRAELALRERMQEREALLKEKDVLLQELRHRIKNSLNMVGAILYLKESEAKTPEVREALNAAHERIDALALLYRQLNEAGGSSVRLDDYLKSICASLSAAHAFSARGLDLAARVEPLHLDLKRGANIGLAVTELLTNAIKYAFPPDPRGGRGGRIELEATADGADIEIIVRDDGIGLPEDFNVERSEGMGFRLVTELVEQCEGSFMRLPAPRGTAFSIRLPL